MSEALATSFPARKGSLIHERLASLSYPDPESTELAVPNEELVLPSGEAERLDDIVREMLGRHTQTYHENGRNVEGSSVN